MRIPLKIALFFGAFMSAEAANATTIELDFRDLGLPFGRQEQFLTIDNIGGTDLSIEVKVLSDIPPASGTKVTFSDRLGLGASSFESRNFSGTVGSDVLAISAAGAPTREGLQLRVLTPENQLETVTFDSAFFVVETSPIPTQDFDLFDNDFSVRGGNGDQVNVVVDGVTVLENQSRTDNATFASFGFATIGAPGTAKPGVLDLGFEGSSISFLAEGRDDEFWLGGLTLTVHGPTVVALPGGMPLMAGAIGLSLVLVRRKQ